MVSGGDQSRTALSIELRHSHRKLNYSALKRPTLVELSARLPTEARGYGRSSKEQRSNTRSLRMPTQASAGATELGGLPLCANSTTSTRDDGCCRAKDS